MDLSQVHVRPDLSAGVLYGSSYTAGCNSLADTTGWVQAFYKILGQRVSEYCGTPRLEMSYLLPTILEIYRGS